MLKRLKSFFTSSPRCPVCGCDNYVSMPFEGRVDQGVIGYDHQFACGFATHWKGYRVKLCSAPHPHPVAQAVSSIVPTAKRTLNGVA